ncbi:RHS repeat domain-containing protein [Aquimarina algicola]|uniref:RHS repeat protein n=1 Tax=Aquimarina algicola TaxID=2589995 RepID=A0A504J935_9FLAO|nr:RHS repeat protein [Aquimarina algicola]TPN87387.1 RHS repeat protein [Aquimarina algicola]
MNRILIGFLLFYGSFYAQSGFDSGYMVSHENYTPVTPNASGFLTYGSTPVNHATGVPQISIPLFTLEEDGVSIPISLSYHAGGVKVDDLSGVVGLKWTLNAGGGIFRQINDKPDESGWLRSARRGFFDDNWIAQHNITDDDTQRLMESLGETHDHHPDDFNYSFAGHSGSFIFHRDGSVGDEQQDQMHIEKVEEVGGNISFLGKDLLGNRFTFKDTKELNSKLIVIGGGANLNFQRETGLTGWMLEKIQTRNNALITFDYVPYSFEYRINNVSYNMSHTEKCKRTSMPQPNGPDIVEVTGPCGCEGTTPYPIDVYETNLTRTSMIHQPTNQLINTIESNNIRVRFHYEEDATLSDWKVKLVSIDILDKIKNKTKQFKFSYGKFSGDPRLRLDSVQEIGFDGEAKPPYRFEYISGALPAKGSLCKDFLGYNNGKENNETLIPFSLEAYRKLNTRERAQLADRKVDISYLKRGTLKKITYPTGGSTIFDYDGNYEMTTRVDYPTFTPDSQTVFPAYDGSVSPFTKEFTIRKNLLGNQGTPVTFTGTSTVCNYSEDNPHIDCSRWNVYPKLSNGNRGASVFGSMRVIGPGPISINLPAGTYIMDLIVERELLSDENDLPIINVRADWTEENDPPTTPEKVYTGGLHVRSITEKDEYNKTTKTTQYTYDAFQHDESGITDYMKNYGVKTVFSSNDIQSDPRDTKSGYYYGKVTIATMGASGPQKTVEYFSPLYRNKAYETVMTRQEQYSGDRLLSASDFEYSNTVEAVTRFYTLPDKDLCIEPQTSALSVLGKYFGYDTPEYHYYNHRKLLLSQRTTVDYLHQEGEPFNASISRYRYEYNNDLQVTKEVLDGRYYATSAAGITTGNLQEHSEGQYSEIRYTYPQDHKSASTTMATLSNKNIIGMPVSKKVLYKGNLIQGQYTDYDGNGNVIAGYRHHKGQASDTSTPSHIPSDYELQATYKTTQGKPIEIHPKDGIPTSVLWDSSYQYVLANLKGVSASDLAGVTAAIDLKTTTDAQLRSLYATLRTTFSEAEITTYIHDPLMGVKEMTDPRGYTAHYDYDGLGRLINVKDQDHFLMTQYKYNYRKQQQ